MKNSTLTALHIGNFKALGETQVIPIRPITLIFGPNSAGKSTIIQSLILAHEIQIAQRGRVAPDVEVHRTELGGGSIDLGGFKQFVHGSGETNRVELGLQLELNDTSTSDPEVDGQVNAQVIVSAHLGLEENKGEFYDEIKNRPIARLKEARGIQSEADDGFDLSDVPIEKPADVSCKDRSARVSTISVLLNAEELIRMSFLGVNSFAQSVMSVSYINILHPFVRRTINSIKRSDEYSKLSEGVVLTDEEVDAFLACFPPRFRSTGLGVAELFSAKNGVSDDSLAERSVAPALTHLSREFWHVIIKFLSKVDERLTDVLRNIVYLGPLRAVPARSFAGIGSDSADWRSGGGGAWEELAKDGDARDAANEWLYRLGIRHRLVFDQAVSLAEIEQSLVRHFLRTSPRVVPTVEALTASAREKLGAAETLKARLAKGERDMAHKLASATTTAQVERIHHEAFSRESEQEEQFHSYILDGAKSDAHDLIEAIRSEAITRGLFRLLDEKTGKFVSFRDVGSGTSQVLPILATALTARRTVVAVEQPELHLHPKLQAELGDIFIESALGDGENIFILETHSEHLILRILAGVRTGKVDPSDLAVLYVMPSDIGSKVMEIRVDEDGDFIDRWPGGFFEESYNERMAGR